MLSGQVEKPGSSTPGRNVKKQTKGFQGASFKSFPSLEEAQQAFSGGKPSYSYSTKKTQKQKC